MRILAFVGLVPALIAMPGAAETAPLVTEAQLLSKLDSDFPAVVERTRLLPLARARLLSERTLENPELELGREDPDGPAAQTQWTLSWQLPGGSRRLEIAAAERSVDAATARAGHELRSLRSALREDYARWSVAWVRRQLLEKETDRLAVLAVRERARAEKGEASGLEAHRLELAAAALRARSSLAVADLKQAHARVGRWLQSLPAGARPGLPTLAPPAEPGK
ncbi:MAG: TolC family protein, partial [Holophagales bacterium]|nr:TolC family protein [Holophagales bacterium]